MVLTCINYSKSESGSMLNKLLESHIENILELRGDINPAVKMKKDFHYIIDLVSFIKNIRNHDYL